MITCHTTGSNKKERLYMYLRFKTPPTESDYAHGGEDDSTTQKVGPLGASILVPCTLYIMVVADTALRRVQLWCDLTISSKELTAETRETLSISTAKQNRYFKISVPQSNKITCHTTGSSQVYLYVQFDKLPTSSSYYDKEKGASTTKTVGPLKEDSTSVRMLYIMVHANAAFSKVQFWCDLTPPTPQLIAGKRETFSIPTAKQNRMFKITVPQSKEITCYTTGSSSSKGDPDLYVNFGAEPTLSSNNGYSKRASFFEVVGPLSVSATSACTLYVMVYANTAFSNVQLWCDLTKKITAAATEAQLSLLDE